MLLSDKGRRKNDPRRLFLFFASGLVLLITFAVLVRPLLSSAPRVEEQSTTGETEPLADVSGEVIDSTPWTEDGKPWSEPTEPWSEESGEQWSEDGKPWNESGETTADEGKTETASDSPGGSWSRHGIPPIEEKWIVRLEGALEAPEHVLITSNTTSNGEYFRLDWGPDYDGFNPNFVPHPVLNDTWYMLAVAIQSTLSDPIEIASPVYSVELYCVAQFIGDTLTCQRSPLQLPIASTTSELCGAEHEGAHWIIGPGESRVFVGEKGLPYIMFVSPSNRACSGPHLQDLRRVLQWYTLDAINRNNPFFTPVDLGRPPPRHYIEKNWFVFWDADGAMYLHFDIYPTRTFAQLDASTFNGDVGEDLSPASYEHDAACMARLMPQLSGRDQLHQATNSLAVVLCYRTDPTCVPSPDNTVILALFQHKRFDGHNLYEPYAFLFRNTAPFQAYGISTRPLWINGRGKPGWSDDFDVHGQSQMMYIQSINWKETGVGYTGYLDDVVMVAFGIEDLTGGGIDVRAEELVRGVGLCEEV